MDDTHGNFSPIRGGQSSEGTFARRAATRGPENPRWYLSARAAVVLACTLVLLLGVSYGKGWIAPKVGAPYASEEELLEQIGASMEDLGQSGVASEPEGAGPDPLQDVIIYVSGAVKLPGVYRLPEGARLVDAVDAGGGAETDADLSKLNLARPLIDGEQVHVPKMGEPVQGTSSAVTPAGADDPACIDPNTAEASQLETLSGIGPALAARIVTHRETVGPFATPDDLQQVSGIGAKIFSRIEPDLCVH